MKKYRAGSFGPPAFFVRKSRFSPVSLFRSWGMRWCSFSLVVFLALFLLIFNLAVLGGTASAYTEGGSSNFFGTGAGAVNTGEWNSFFGGYAGTANTDGIRNSFFGHKAGQANTTGNYNSFLGSFAGQANMTGATNSFFGDAAGAYNTTGNGNSFFGASAGSSNTTGIANTYIGNEAGTTATGSGNTFIGNRAGFSATTGWRSVMLGEYAGYDNVNGGGNVFIGWNAGAQELGSNRLYIDNSNTPTPLIYGEFDTRLLKVGGSLGVGTTPVRQLHVAGSNAVFRMDRSVDTASFMLVRTDVSNNPLKTFVVGTNALGANTGEFVINDLGTAVAGPGNRRMTITNNGAVDFPGIVTAPQFIPMSSLAFKTNVQTYENALDTVNRLRGVRFDWKDSGEPSVGLIAEEVDRVIPEVVSREGGAAKGVNYDSLVGVLVEAVKEQQVAISKQQEINAQQQEINTQQQEAISQQREAISQLMAEITRLKSRDMMAQR
jgi:hypothetical protein